MSKPIWVKWHPKDALDGTLLLSVWEEVAYRRILDMIYSTDDNLPDDDTRLARMTKLGKRWPAVKKTLISMGKIQVQDGRITNERCAATLSESRQKIAQQVGAGRSSSRVRKSLKDNKTASTDVGFVSVETTSTNQISEVRDKNKNSESEARARAEPDPLAPDAKPKPQWAHRFSEMAGSQGATEVLAAWKRQDWKECDRLARYWWERRRLGIVA